MRIGVTGYTSRIGKSLIQRGCIPLDLDITKYNIIDMVLAKKQPDIIVNLAARSDVDWCEVNFEEALSVNVRGFYNLCTSAETRNIPVVALSTDHIWNGKTGWDANVRAFTRAGPYKESYPRFAPVNQYGLTKVGMETLASAFDNVKIVRTSYCFDYERLHLEIKMLKENIPVKYPDFVFRSFMHIEHFTDAFMVYLNKFYEMPTVLHISGNKVVSWYGFMSSLADVYGLNASLVSPKHKDDKGLTPRPHKAGLEVSLSKKLSIPQFNYL